MRLGIVLILLVPAVAIAGTESSQLTHSESDQEDQRLMREDQQQLELQHQKLREDQREREREARQEELAKEDFERERQMHEDRRWLSYKLAMAGGGLEVVAGVAAYLGHRNNLSLRNDPSSTPDDIRAAEARGGVYNKIGYATALAGAVAIIAAVPLFVLNLDHGEYQVAPIAGGDEKGVSLSGRF